MLRIFFVGPALLLTMIAAAQKPRMNQILKAPEEKIEYYELSAAGSKILYLPMSYGKSSFTENQEEAIRQLKNSIVARIDLVYSDYPAKHDFTNLSRQRLESLNNIFPGAFKDSTIEFRKLRQTIAISKESAEELDHGFFIYYRTLPSKESAKLEIEELKTVLKSLKDPDSIVEPSIEDFRDTMRTIMDSLTLPWCTMTTVLVDTSFDLPPDTGIVKTIKKYSVKDYMASGLSPQIQPESYVGWDSVYYCKYERKNCITAYDSLAYEGEVMRYEEIDSTVARVFGRNKWSNSLVVADVTGSMYPYTSQLIHWLKLNLTDKKVKTFVFFNDGDDKSDEKKIIGKTGGIYSISSGSFDDVAETILKAMKNGSGGDAPENNIEALIAGINKCDNCESVILIADNWAPVKDIRLLSSINKPVKVVVCGVLGRINKDYLKIARDTKGSLHLMEEDILTLSEMKEGETIKIQGKIYKLLNGEFVDITGVST